MGLLAVFDGGPDHRVELYALEQPAGQSLARCTCGWSDINVRQHLTQTAARAHIRQHRPAPAPTKETP